MKKSARNPQSPATRIAKKFPPAPQASDANLSGLQLCFFFSGAAGLIYQVAWSKSLGQLFGYSAYAVATVLAVFMGGMAIGSAVFAKWRPADRSGIALYAWMEFAIAATALLSLPGTALVRQIYFASYSHASGSSAALLAIRFAGAALVLGLPTLLMGGTLPVLLGSVAQQAGELGVRAGRFYAINTLGAVAGTIAAGFLLIPWLGLRSTVAIAVILNVAAGFLAQKLARNAVVNASSDAESAAATENARAAQSEHFALYLFCFAGVGASAIAYELAWTRLLATPLGSSTYAFTVMLATFLLGITIGSRLFARWFRKKREASASLFASTQLAIAAAILLSLWTYREIPEVMLALLRTFGDGFYPLLAAQVLTCSLALLPATILFGFNFPAVLALISGAGTRGNGTIYSGAIGKAAAANTFGAIVAAICGGFFLLPRVGSFRLVAIAAGVNVVSGVVLLFFAGRRNWKSLAIAAALLAAIAWTAWSPLFFRQASAAFGVVLYGDYHNTALSAREMADSEAVRFFKDGINATISVTQSENYIALKTNGKVDASNLDSATQLLLGDLGAVFHPHPRKVLIIGFGGGMTASAVSRFPDVERIDCVEIEPAVLEAAAHLERLNRGVLRDPRLHVYFDDARNFLQTSHEQYDLIISEPSNPWIAGIAALYTEEFFGVVRAHVAIGGNFVQWVQAYGLNLDDFSMILGGIHRHFPDTSLWHSAGRDYLVLARDSTEPLSFDRSRSLWTNALLREDFAALNITQPESWPIYFRLDKTAIDKIAGGAPRNTDDLTALEYSAPAHLRTDRLTKELETALAAFEQSPLPRPLSSLDAQLAAGASAEAALESAPPRAERFLNLVRSDETDPKLLVLRARTTIEKKQFAEAIAQLQPIARKGDNLFDSQYWLAEAQIGQGLQFLAEGTIDQLLARHPDHQLGLALKVKLSADHQLWDAAIASQTHLGTLRPDSAAEQCHLGDLYLRARHLALADAPLERGVALDSFAFLCHRDLGELYRATAKLSDAIRELEWVVRYFPEGDPKTYVSLALAYQVIGQRSNAEATLAKGRRLFPTDDLLQKFQLNRE